MNFFKKTVCGCFDSFLAVFIQEISNSFNLIGKKLKVY